MFRSTLLHRIVLICLLAFALLSFASRSAVAACEPPECYATDTPEPGSPSDDGDPWDGYTDGRLNPDRAEFYNIYCHDDHIYVLGGNPTPELVDTIPISQVVSMGDGDVTFSPGVGLMITRSGDQVTVAGGHGNIPDQSGSKSFSLTQCILRNGGSPPVPPPPSNPGTGLLNDLCPDTVPVSQLPRICFDSEGDWCVATNYADSDCIPYSFARFLGEVVYAAFRCLASIMGLGGFAGVFVFSARRRRGSR